MTLTSPSIAICICTYKRPQLLRHLLQGLAKQQFKRMPPPVLTIIVVDNEGNDEARIVCESEQPYQRGHLIYVRERQRGISYARNTCLAHVPGDCDFIAMIDDDEFPEPHWLEQLIIVQRATGADVVQGPVHAILPASAPNWMRQGKFFGWPYYLYSPKPIAWEDRTEISSASTNNVLICWPRLRPLGLVFDTRLALSGGEDLMFFRQLRDAGFRFAFARNANVSETVPPERARFWYLCRVGFRDGCLKPAFKLLRNTDRGSLFQRLKRRSRSTGNGILHILVGGYSLLRCAVFSRSSGYSLALASLSIVYGAGLVAGSFGLRYQHYK
ncbi:MAG: glycosyltransferase family 2 protein [Hyphomicrobiales bacterium]|nr:glycosyltransferase family 2 protein [Hyphomicrobiales bacterium]